MPHVSLILGLALLAACTSDRRTDSDSACVESLVRGDDVCGLGRSEPADAAFPDVRGLRTDAGIVVLDGGGGTLPLSDGGRPTYRPTSLWAFVTSQPLPSPTSLVDADLTCTRIAAEADHEGVFRAWLSDSNTDAIDRIGGPGTWSIRTPYTTDRIFGNESNLRGSPRNALEFDEHGRRVPYSTTGVWTNTNRGGRAAGAACWEGAGSISGGSYDEEDTSWTQYQTMGCTSEAHLYCFEVARYQ